MGVTNTYELAFHLNPNLDEASVAQTKEDIEKLVTSSGGAILFSKEPEKTRLSYPIKKQTMSYFGYMHFNINDPENLKQIQEQVALNPAVLRFLTIKFDADLQKRQDAAKRAASAERAKKIKASAQKAESDKHSEPPVKEEELEKKLEEIIEKL